MPNYKLTYFNGRGRAELARLLFAQAGVKYEDCRITGEQWAELKPKTPWGGLPVLEFDDKMFGQSTTIARYIARENGLAGKNSVDQCKTDSFVDAIQDIFQNIAKIHFEKDEGKKAEMEKKFQETDLPKNLGDMEKFLTANEGGDGYLVGDCVTWADIGLLNFYHMLETFGKSKEPFKSKGFHKLEALVQRVAKLPRIEQWLKTRPETNF